MSRIRIMFGHAGVSLMALACAVAFLAMLWGAPLWCWALVPLGIAAQMLNKYNLHRHIFHLDPPKRQWAFNLLYRAHYGHHDFPTNHGLFFVPLWVALPMLVGNFLLVWGIAALLGFEAAIWIATAIVPLGGC